MVLTLRYLQLTIPLDYTKSYKYYTSWNHSYLSGKNCHRLQVYLVIRKTCFDRGFQKVNLFEKNYFDSLRMVASSRNEELLLDSDLFPGDRSFSMLFNLVTTDTRISPAIDLDNASVVFTSNRVNQPVTNYADDFKVSTTTEDPNRFFYVSKNITLENPATSLEVLLGCTLFNKKRYQSLLCS